MKVTIKNLKAVKWQDIVVFKNGIYYATIGKDPSFYRDGKHMFFHIGTTEASTAVEIFNIAKNKNFEIFDAKQLKKPRI